MAALGFLGMGAPAANAGVGHHASDVLQFAQKRPAVTFPLAILLTVLAFK